MTTVFPFPFVKPQYFDSSGNVLANGTINTYLAGTTTPVATYTDATGTTQNPVSITLGADGRPPNSGIYGDEAVSYKIEALDSSGAVQWTIDEVQAFKTTITGGSNINVSSSDVISMYYPLSAGESAAGVVPVDYSYQVGYVQRYGATGNGTTDDSTAISNANKSSDTVYFPAGTYRVSTALTLTAALNFENGAILFPDANIAITINGPIQAGPWQIFNVTNTSASITGIAQPVNTDGRVYTEWFGAKGDGVTDDAAAFNATAAFAYGANLLGIQLLAKTYVLKSTVYADSGIDTQTYTSPSWYGISSDVTILSYPNIAAAPAFQLRGGSGATPGAFIENIQFTGSSTSYGILFSGKCHIAVKNCRFETNAEGVRWINNDAGSFTEFCTLDRCLFDTTCTLPGHFMVASGNVSFHGSGFKNRCLSRSAPTILVDAGCLPYNAPLDFQLWTQTPNSVVIQNNSTQPVNFHGVITIECSATNNAILGGGQLVPFYGVLEISNEHCVRGTLTQAAAGSSNSNGSLTLVNGRENNSIACTTGSNTLTNTNINGYNRLTYVQLQAAQYDYRYLLSVCNDGSGAAGIVNTIATIKTFNTAGYGAPTFTANASGQLVITNASFPTSGVTAYISEITLCPGPLGGIQLFV